MRKHCLRRLLITAAVATVPLIAHSSIAAVNDIFESNQVSDTGVILRFRPVGGTPLTLVPDLTNPKGVVFDGNGNVYVADASRGAIYRYTSADGQGGIFAQDLASPVGLTFSTAGDLYSSDAGSGTIFKFSTSDGTKTTFATGLDQPAGMAFDTQGNLFVADFTNGALYKIAPDGSRTTFASGLSFPAGVAIDPMNNVFVADSGSDQILKFTPSGDRTVFVGGLDAPYGIAFETNGNLIVADHDSGSTLRFTPSGERFVLFQSDFNSPQFVAIEPAAHQVLNISSRAFVGGGDHNIIAGFIVGGIGPVGTNVVVRALGPSLPAVITDRLADPVLEVRDATGTLLAVNDNWQDAPPAQRVPASLEPTDPHDAAVLLKLGGGNYTAVVYGAGGATGTALVEVYHLQL
jgi:sugar lactone lactonase YvrE